MDKDIDLAKVDKTSPDLLLERLNELKRLFPDLFDGEGNIDEKELRNLISEYNNPQVEKFTFEWAGKANSKKLAFKPSKATLTPDKDRSIDFDNTENLIIEGDNLEVLKLLQKSYYEKVKCIYIDPPYNTGNDFIYTDDYNESKKAYWEKNGQVHDGVKLDSNTEFIGKYHSNWLDMMQSRLLLARRFLCENGVIFVSIDDNEVHNLRKLMDEVFGEENFLSQINWQKKKENANDNRGFSSKAEYILVYSKTDTFEVTPLPLSENYLASSYNEPTKEFPEGKWRPVPIAVSKGHQGSGYEYEIITPAGTRIKRLWLYPEKGYKELEEMGRLYFGKNGDGIPQRIMYASESSGTPPDNLWINVATNKEGKKELVDLFGSAVFDTTKPTALIKQMLKIATTPIEGAFVMDFFAGSGTTGHAVMDLNKEDGGNRRFILVQLPEYTEEKSEAYKAGYKRISDITIERVKRAGERIKKEKDSVDTGFKVFSLVHSNFRENTWTPDSNLTEEENIKVFQAYLNKANQPSLFEDAKETESIITEIALKQGYTLNFSYTKVDDFAKNTLYEVKSNGKSMLVCLDQKLHEDTVDKLLELKDNKFVCLKNALDTTHSWKLNKTLGRNLEVI